MTNLNWWIVDRYFAGEATAAERVIVERWLDESPAFRMLVSEMYRGALDDETVRKAAVEVRARLECDTAAPHKPRQRRTSRETIGASRSHWSGVFKAAAAIALLVGGVLVMWPMVRVANVRQSKVTLRTVTAPLGRRTALSLPDGSEVILSPGSTIRYALAFDAERRREIWLEGEAYFAVQHDALRPFSVRAGDLVAEDLGTQFVVRAYPEDSHGRVVVREGLVWLAGTVLGPGDLGRLSAQGKPIVESADTATWFAWTRGQLVFPNTPLRDALPKLSRWYDIEFQLADRSLGDIRLVGAVPEQLGDDELKALGLALGVHLVREGRVVTFYFRPPTPPLQP